ncbi:hypothetical protein [Comamonas sp. JC664]|uniref:hypothetical protein n=1 Tax=Comamonas sp. JC664 TaxID=2801917 RepID=UPI003618CB7A
MGLDADVYGLMEIQNNGFETTSALAALTRALNAQHGSDVYDYVKGPSMPVAAKRQSLQA